MGEIEEIVDCGSKEKGTFACEDERPLLNTYILFCQDCFC